ncbi:MAG: hypothetical protein RBT67_07505 [Thauera sp.]|jgi:hypothetical protein|nr:hypothetical protein [Thauera sp.]
MTPQDWKDIEQAIAYPYGRAKLRVDGHELTLAVELWKRLRYVVVVYIDGKIQWGRTSRPEADAIERKFWRARRIYLYSAKQRAHAADQAKKRRMPADLRAYWTRQAEASFEMLDPTFASGKAACAHLRKHCTAIERVRDDAEAEPVPEHAQ